VDGRVLETHPITTAADPAILVFNGYSKAKEALDDEIEAAESRRPGPGWQLSRDFGASGANAYAACGSPAGYFRAWLGARVSRDHLRSLPPRKGGRTRKA